MAEKQIRHEGNRNDRSIIYTMGAPLCNCDSIPRRRRRFRTAFFLGVIGFTVGTDDDDETSMQTMNTFTKALTSLL